MFFKAANSALESLVQTDLRASYILHPCTPVFSAGHIETVGEIKQILTMKINILCKEKRIRNKFHGSHVGGVGIFNTKVISTDLF